MSQKHSENHLENTSEKDTQYDAFNEPSDNRKRFDGAKFFPSAETILKSWKLDRKLPAYFFAVNVWLLNILVEFGNVLSLRISSLYSRMLHIGERPVHEEPDPPRWLIYIISWLSRLIFPLQAFGTRRIPRSRRLLFVGNHQNYGLDSISIAQEIHRTTGMYPRVLADRIHHKIPIFKQILEYFGSVPGTPENCRILMNAGSPILVFPGGHREAMKHAGTPKYNLEWRDRLGFAKMAMEHEYQVVPLAMIGMEDTFETWFDIPVTPLLWLFGDMRNDYVFPVPKLWKVQPQKNYLEFGDAIAAASFGHDATNIPQATALRDEVLGSIRKMLQELLLWQSRDPKRYPCGMLRNYIRECIIRHMDKLGLNGTQLAEAVGLWKPNPEIVVMIGE